MDAKKVRNNSKASFVLFFISPILGLLESFKSINQKSTQRFLMFFLAFYGFTVYVPATKDYIDLSVDSTYYRIHFENVSIKETFGEYIHRFIRYLTFDIDEVGDVIKDYYLETIGYVASFLGNNYHVMFMIAALVAGYYCISSMRYLFKDTKYDYSVYYLCLLLVFLYNQPIQIHWLRFPTAAWIAVYSTFKIFFENKRKYWILAASTILIHGSFVSFILFLVLAKCTKKYEYIWVSVFFVSLFMSSVPSNFVENLADMLPGRLGMYLHYGTQESLDENSDLIKGRRTGNLVMLFGTLQNIFMNVLMFLIIKNREKRNKDVDGMFAVTLIIFTIVNMFSFIYEFSMRYRLITYPLVIYLWLHMFGTEKKYKGLVYLIPVVFSYQMAYYAYLYMKTSGWSLIYPPIISVFNSMFDY